MIKEHWEENISRKQPMIFSLEFLKARDKIMRVAQGLLIRRIPWHNMQAVQIKFRWRKLKNRVWTITSRIEHKKETEVPKWYRYHLIWKHEDFDKAVKWRTILSEIEDNRLRPPTRLRPPKSLSYSFLSFVVMFCFRARWTPCWYPSTSCRCAWRLWQQLHSQFCFPIIFNYPDPLHVPSIVF